MINCIGVQRGTKINDIKYKYNNHAVEKVKLSKEFIAKNPKLNRRFFKYGWEIEGVDCTFGSLSTALDFIDGIV